MNNTMMECPVCQCELFIITGSVFRCFLCGRKFYNKNFLLHKNMYSLNKKLAFIAKRDIQKEENKTDLDSNLESGDWEEL